MDDEKLFVNIDLNDDNICSVCKLETETGTLSFCHVCFELSIEGKWSLLVCSFIWGTNTCADTVLGIQN